MTRPQQTPPQADALLTPSPIPAPILYPLPNPNHLPPRHGTLPCCRDREHEAYLAKVKAAADTERRVEQELNLVNPVMATSSRGLKLRIPKEIADELEALRAAQARAAQAEGGAGRQAFAPASRV